MSTKTRLAAALLKVGADDMADKALDGFYDDFESPLATPIIQLVQDCEARGFRELAERARNGAFDASREEAEAWAKRAGFGKPV